MKEKTLTIIIPCYNTSKLLPKALDSILKYPAQIEDLEVLVVNDGSKDSTLSVAQEYAERYPSIIRAIDKPNGGWGSVINHAIPLATGKYLRVLDSDDWLNEDEFPLYMELLRSCNTDIVATNCREIYADNSYKDFIVNKDQIDKTYSFDDYLKNNDNIHSLNLSIVTLKKSVLDIRDYNIPDRYYADIPFIMYPLRDVQTIYFSNLNIYRYWKGNEGQSTSLIGYNSHLTDFINVVKDLVLFYETNKASLSHARLTMYEIDFARLIDFCYYMLLASTYSGCKKESKKILRDFDSWLKRISNTLYNKSGQRKAKGKFPFIKIWRTTRFNILKITKWI